MSIVPSSKEAAARRTAGVELARALDPEAGRLRVLSTFNLDLLPPYVVEALHRAGLAAQVSVGPFGQLHQEVLNPSSSLYADEPSEVLLVPAAEDLLEPLFSLPSSRLDPEAADALVEERLAELGEIVGTLVDRLPDATCYVVAFGTDRAPVPHLLDPVSAERRQLVLERFVNGVRDLGRTSSRVVVVDWDWHVRASGWDAVRDERLWYLGRMRLSQVGCAALAELVARHAAAHRGRPRKVVALDLDGTLWGGVIGEAGLSGIEIGEDGIGLAFQDLQRELLKLHDTGVLLVACSKNNLDDAIEAFERHPGMILRREHLAAERINWQDKATNLGELADELDLGLDSFVFLDDNPVERTWVAEACPEVLVPELPAEPAERPAFLRGAPWFARIGVTDADRTRATSYQEQRERRQLRQTTASFEDFLASLEQQAAIEPVDEATAARAAQLCQRTNQFNLTTKRYTLGEVEQLAADPDADVLTLGVRDRFGDSGITGVAIVRYVGEEAQIDTLLMSCRILGRKLEDAFLAVLAERAAQRGSTVLTGTYEPTAKNMQVAGFYEEKGFSAGTDGVFRYDLRQGRPELPAEVAVEVGSSA